MAPGDSGANTVGHSSRCLDVSVLAQSENLLPYMSHFWDAESVVNVPNVLDGHKLYSQLASFDFKQVLNPDNEYVLGLGTSNHWLSFCLSNFSADARELVLASSPAVIAEIDYYPQLDGVRSFQTGSDKPMATRDIHGPEFDFNISLAPQQTQHYYLRVKSRNTAYIIASVWHKPAYLVAKDKRETIDGVLAGILIGLILYTMLLYFSVRQSSSLLYILWSTSTLILLASIDGRVLQYLVPNLPAVAIYSTVLFYPITLILSALFARDFIQLNKYPRLDKIGVSFIGLSIVVLTISYVFGYSFYFKANALFAFFVVLYFGLLCPFYALIVKRSILARYLLIAQFPLIICVLDRSLFSIGVTAQHYIPYTAKVGLVAEMILLAYCIGLTIYSEKNEAQRLALEQLELSNELKSNYNKELETEILENTAEIRSMNSDLEQQAKQLLELNEVKSKFFANISHEFRTPLTLIQGPLGQLLESGDHPNKEVINGAIRQSKDLQILIDQLLTLSKFDGQSLTLQAQKNNVSQVVERITSQFSSLVESKNIHLDFNASAPEIEAYIDLEKLQIMLNNLMSNAIKFTDSGGRISVRVSTRGDTYASTRERSTDEYVQIAVADTGHGIPSDELAYVFDRFFQSRSSAQAGSGVGTGIGLALVKELATLHAGEVSVQSVHDNSSSDNELVTGSVFTIKLPLGRAHLTASEVIELPTKPAPKKPTPERLNASEASTGALETNVLRSQAALSSVSSKSTPEKSPSELIELQEPETTILIVDDNDAMRAYIRSLLEPTYRVVEAFDGLQAEDKVKQHSPNLIVTDLMMPKRDGLSFVKSLKKDGEFSKIPVIMLTAKAGIDDRLKGLVAAVDDYLAKPFDARELKTRIENLLHKHAQLSAFYDVVPNSPKTVDTVNDAKQTLDQTDDDFIVKLRSIVNEQLKDPTFGVTQLAQLMHVSKATLHRRLSDSGKFTPSEYIRHCRLEKARQLSLAGDARSIRELAHEVGFNQAAYFARLYHKTFNTSPMIDNDDNVT